jgi:hypothetical protein
MKKKTIKIETTSLDKETIARLNTPELQNLLGGGSYSCNGGNIEIDGNDDEQITTIQSCCYETCNYN